MGYTLAWRLQLPYQEVFKMFKVMKQRDLIKEVERQGFVLIRDAEHKVFRKGEITLIIPHSKTISSGLVHQTFKTLKKAA
jgi:predicted RNA binding protein YcfA (HicA-like mRNA interferase family)